MTERNTNIPAAFLILRDGDKVLLQRRFNTGYADGQYSLVAGHVDEGETFTQAIIREAREEANLELEEVQMVHMMHRKGEDGSERTDAFFVADKWSGEIKNLESHKCDDLNWFELSNLPENTLDYIKIVLGLIQEGVFYSEFGWNK